MRIAFYYGWVWVSIAGIIVIYTRVGYEIFVKDKQFKAVQNSGPLSSSSGTGNGKPDSTTSPAGPFTGTRTTQVEISTQDQQCRHEIASPTIPATAHTRPRGVKENYSITIDATGPTLASTTGTYIRRPSSSRDKVKRQYAKVAFLFAISTLVIWIPASINRGLGLRYPNTPSYFWNAFSAAVLPLQGLFNMLIFFATSTRQCKQQWAEFKKWKEEWLQKRREGGFQRMAIVLPGGRREVTGGKETDSMVELSTNRESASRGADSFSA
jgi:hypothetical protein